MRLRPLFTALALLVVGIVCSAWCTFPPAVAYFVFALSVVVCGLAARRAPVLLLVPFLFFGLARAREVSQLSASDIANVASERLLTVHGQVISAPDRDAFGGASFDLAVVAPGSGVTRVKLREAPFPRYGDRITLRGTLSRPLPATNPGGFDYQAFLARRGIHSQFLVKRTGNLTVERPQLGIATLTEAIRAAVHRTTTHFLRPDDSALLQGILLGERTPNSAALDQAFTTTGTVHILSTSGLHLTAFAALIGWIFGRLFPRSRWLRTLVTLSLCWLFALTVGGGPAVTRSAILLTVVQCAPLLRRDSEPLHALALAALLILAAQPLALYDPGTQLSFCCVGALFIYTKLLDAIIAPWEPDLSPTARAARWVLLALAASVVAHLASWLLVAYHFNLVSIVAPVANIPIAALSELIVLFGVAGVVFAGVPGLNFCIWGLLALLLGALRGMTLAFAAVPFAAVSMVSPPVWVVVLYTLLLIAPAGWVRKRVKRRLFAL